MPLTNFSPKCLIEIDGNPLLYYLLSDLKKLGVNEVIIVTGYRSDMIEEYVKNRANFPDVRCIYNQKYETTNSIVSISLTRDYWHEDFCIIDSDLIIKYSLLETLINAKTTSLLIDNSKPADDIDMKAKVENGFLKYMDKGLLRKDTFGEFFGLSRWTPEAGQQFSQSIDKMLSEKGESLWYEFAIRDMAANFDLPIITCSFNKWFEIDNSEDYEKAKNLVQNGFYKN